MGIKDSTPREEMHSRFPKICCTNEADTPMVRGLKSLGMLLTSYLPIMASQFTLEHTPFLTEGKPV